MKDVAREQEVRVIHRDKYMSQKARKAAHKQARQAALDLEGQW